LENRDQIVLKLQYWFHRGQIPVIHDYRKHAVFFQRYWLFVLQYIKV